MIGGVNYNDPLQLEAFVKKFTEDKNTLTALQEKVAKLGQQHIRPESSQELIELKRSVTHLQASLETFGQDTQVLRQIGTHQDLIDQIKGIIHQDYATLFTFLNSNRAINEAYSTLNQIRRLHQPELDLASLVLISEKEELTEQDYREVQDILQRNPYILFDKLEGKSSIFSQLMKSPHAHPLFDLIISTAGEVFREEFRQKTATPQLKEGMREILDFAFSRVRYDHCYAQDHHMDEAMKVKAQSLLARCTVKDLKTKMQRFESQFPEEFANWQSKRRSTSASLHKEYVNSKTLRKNWESAAAFVLNKAHQDVGKPTQISRESIEAIHRRMAAEDPEIPNPGVTRDVLNKQVALGGVGGWGGNTCGPSHLSERLDELVSWMNDQFLECHEGRKNPLIFAAQTYQRIVSLHPFENGNGRIARLMMDYVLARYEIPPIVMGQGDKDVNIAVLPLLSDESRNSPEFYNNMLNRMAQSFAELPQDLRGLI